MPRNRDERQFEDYRDWQWCKHLAIRKYVKPWSVIVGSSARDIFVVDSHAGAASYRHPHTAEVIAEGSPVIFARRAAEYTAERGPGKSMRVICVERNRNNYRSLVQALEPYSAHVITRPGRFARYVPDIIEMTAGAPMLGLLDPIGVASITAESWRPLLERKEKTDLFIVLDLTVVHRIGGWLLPDGEPNPKIGGSRMGARTIDAVFSEDRRWREIACDKALAGEGLFREERERRYVKLYFESVIGDRHRWKCAFDVRALFDSPVKYWLIHASDDLKPYLLMNDQIVELNEILYARQYAPEGSFENFAEAALDARREGFRRDLEQAILRLLVEAPDAALPFGAIRDQLINTFFGKVKQGAYSSTVKELFKRGFLTRQERAGAAVKEAEMIALATPPATSTDCAAVVPIRRVA